MSRQIPDAPSTTGGGTNDNGILSTSSVPLPAAPLSLPSSSSSLLRTTHQLSPSQPRPPTPPQPRPSAAGLLSNISIGASIDEPSVHPISLFSSNPNMSRMPLHLGDDLPSHLTSSSSSSHTNPQISASGLVSATSLHNNSNTLCTSASTFRSPPRLGDNLPHGRSPIPLIAAIAPPSGSSSLQALGVSSNSPPSIMPNQSHITPHFGLSSKLQRALQTPSLLQLQSSGSTTVPVTSTGANGGNIPGTAANKSPLRNTHLPVAFASLGRQNQQQQSTGSSPIPSSQTPPQIASSLQTLPSHQLPNNNNNNNSHASSPFSHPHHPNSLLGDSSTNIAGSSALAAGTASITSLSGSNNHMSFFSTQNHPTTTTAQTTQSTSSSSTNTTTASQPVPITPTRPFGSSSITPGQKYQPLISTVSSTSALADSLNAHHQRTATSHNPMTTSNSLFQTNNPNMNFSTSQHQHKFLPPPQQQHAIASNGNGTSLNNNVTNLNSNSVASQSGLTSAQTQAQYGSALLSSKPTKTQPFTIALPQATAQPFSWYNSLPGSNAQNGSNGSAGGGAAPFSHNANPTTANSTVNNAALKIRRSSPSDPTSTQIPSFSPPPALPLRQNKPSTATSSQDDPAVATDGEASAGTISTDQSPSMAPAGPPLTAQQLADIAKELANKTNNPMPSTWQPCRCRKSKCIKLYCPCFANGGYCQPQCQCKPCHNRREKEEARARSRRAILERDPTAFLRVQQHNLRVSSRGLIDASLLSSLNSNTTQESSSTITNTPVPGQQQSDGINSSQPTGTAVSANNGAPLDASAIAAAGAVTPSGCHCRKSHCTQMYCICYSAGLPCTDQCDCTDCCNGAANSNTADETVEEEQIETHSQQHETHHGAAHGHAHAHDDQQTTTHQEQQQQQQTQHHHHHHHSDSPQGLVIQDHPLSQGSQRSQSQSRLIPTTSILSSCHTSSSGDADDTTATTSTRLKSMSSSTAVHASSFGSNLPSSSLHQPLMDFESAFSTTSSSSSHINPSRLSQQQRSSTTPFAAHRLSDISADQFQHFSSSTAHGVTTTGASSSSSSSSTQQQQHANSTNNFATTFVDPHFLQATGGKLSHPNTTTGISSTAASSSSVLNNGPKQSSMSPFGFVSPNVLNASSSSSSKPSTRASAPSEPSAHASGTKFSIYLPTDFSSAFPLTNNPVTTSITAASSSSSSSSSAAATVTSSPNITDAGSKNSTQPQLAMTSSSTSSSQDHHHPTSSTSTLAAVTNIDVQPNQDLTSSTSDNTITRPAVPNTPGPPTQGSRAAPLVFSPSFASRHNEPSSILANRARLRVAGPNHRDETTLSRHHPILFSAVPAPSGAGPASSAVSTLKHPTQTEAAAVNEESAPQTQIVDQHVALANTNPPNHPPRPHFPSNMYPLSANGHLIEAQNRLSQAVANHGPLVHNINPAEPTTTSTTAPTSTSSKASRPTLQSASTSTTSTDNQHSQEATSSSTANLRRSTRIRHAAVAPPPKRPLTHIVPPPKRDLRPATLRGRPFVSTRPQPAAGAQNSTTTLANRNRAPQHEERQREPASPEWTPQRQTKQRMAALAAFETHDPADFDPGPRIVQTRASLKRASQPPQDQPPAPPQQDEQPAPASTDTTQSAPAARRPSLYTPSGPVSVTTRRMTRELSTLADTAVTSATSSSENSPNGQAPNSIAGPVAGASGGQLDQPSLATTTTSMQSSSSTRQGNGPASGHLVPQPINPLHASIQQFQPMVPPNSLLTSSTVNKALPGLPPNFPLSSAPRQDKSTMFFSSNQPTTASSVSSIASLAGNNASRTNRLIAQPHFSTMLGGDRSGLVLSHLNGNNLSSIQQFTANTATGSAVPPFGGPSAPFHSSVTASRTNTKTHPNGPTNGLAGNVPQSLTAFNASGGDNGDAGRLRLNPLVSLAAAPHSSFGLGTINNQSSTATNNTTAAASSSFLSTSIARPTAPTASSTATAQADAQHTVKRARVGNQSVATMIENAADHPSAKIQHTQQQTTTSASGTSNQ